MIDLLQPINNSFDFAQDIEKLKKMLKISEMRQDIMGRFHNALYLGDVQERVKLLEEVGYRK